MEKQRHIEWELGRDPHVYDKPRCNEFIDRQTLIHIICNVDCPDGVDQETCMTVLNAVAETLALFPYFKLPLAKQANLKLLEDAGFEV